MPSGETKTQIRRSIPQGDFNTIGTLKLGDVSVADIFSHHFGQTSKEFDIHNPDLYVVHDDYIYACQAAGIAVRISEAYFNAMKKKGGT